jgi:hypothetical protein
MTSLCRLIRMAWREVAVEHKRMAIFLRGLANRDARRQREGSALTLSMSGYDIAS